MTLSPPRPVIIHRGGRLICVTEWNRYASTLQRFKLSPWTFNKRRSIDNGCKLRYPAVHPLCVIIQPIKLNNGSSILYQKKTVKCLNLKRESRSPIIFLCWFRRLNSFWKTVLQHKKKNWNYILRKKERIKVNYASALGSNSAIFGFGVILLERGRI